MRSLCRAQFVSNDVHLGLCRCQRTNQEPDGKTENRSAGERPPWVLFRAERSYEGRFAVVAKAIVGEKLGMTQIWDDDDRVVPVTVLKVQSCRIVQIKRPETDGYSALQVTYGTQRPERLTQPELGHLHKTGVKPGHRLIEFRLDDVGAYEAGQELGAETFNSSELVDVTGLSKGKGFTGTIKRHNFSGQKASHGTHKVHRKPGAVGQCATPSRIFRGKKMPGRSGAEKVTTLNLRIVRVDSEKNLILVKGSVPGRRGSTVLIRSAIKSKQQ